MMTTLVIVLRRIRVIKMIPKSVTKRMVIKASLRKTVFVITKKMLRNKGSERICRQLISFGIVSGIPATSRKSNTLLHERRDQVDQK